MMDGERQARGITSLKTAFWVGESPMEITSLSCENCMVLTSCMEFYYDC
jgi:hypothetical protein